MAPSIGYALKLDHERAHWIGGFGITAVLWIAKLFHFEFIAHAREATEMFFWPVALFTAIAIPWLFKLHDTYKKKMWPAAPILVVLIGGGLLTICMWLLIS